MMWKPRSGCADSYPLDLDGAERQVRFRTGVSPRPYPPIIGCVSGFLPQMNPAVWAGMYFKEPWGPGVTTVPVNLQWQITVPGLQKVS